MDTEMRLLNFVSADQIYEYYCLLALYSSFVELGYEEDSDSRNVYCYNIDERYYKRADDVNTFYFKRNNEIIVLYSQPVVYSYKDTKTNGISLFRTDKNFYTPDFIIKHINKKSEINYLIMDSKWRPRSNVEFEKMIYKYLVGIADNNGALGKKFMWILQGKDDGKKENFNLNRGEVSRTKSKNFMYQTGILTLTPKTGKQKLTTLIDIFLNDES